MIEKSLSRIRTPTANIAGLTEASGLTSAITLAVTMTMEDEEEAVVNRYAYLSFLKSKLNRVPLLSLS